MSGDSDRFEDWLRYARGDLAAAGLMLKSDLLEHAAFQLQQCVEKALKSILVKRGDRPPKTHDLGRLYDLVGPNPSVPFELIELEEMTTWAIAGRYPGEPIIPPDRAAMEGAAIKLEGWPDELS